VRGVDEAATGSYEERDAVRRVHRRDAQRGSVCVREGAFGRRHETKGNRRGNSTQTSDQSVIFFFFIFFSFFGEFFVFVFLVFFLFFCFLFFLFFLFLFSFFCFLFFGFFFLFFGFGFWVLGFGFWF
jgi:hypothetical protein